MNIVEETLILPKINLRLNVNRCTEAVFLPRFFIVKKTYFRDRTRIGDQPCQNESLQQIREVL